AGRCREHPRREPLRRVRRQSLPGPGGDPGLRLPRHQGADRADRAPGRQRPRQGLRPAALAGGGAAGAARLQAAARPARRALRTRLRRGQGQGARDLPARDQQLGARVPAAQRLTTGEDMDSIDTRTLQQLDAAHHLHPFNDNAALAKRGTRVLVRGEGCHVWDAEGHKLLDAFAGLWCVNIGYGRKELGEAAMRQMQQLAYYNTFFHSTTEPTVRLAAKLAELCPGDLNHAFFTNSGSEANDTILRLVRHFWAVQGKPEKSIFIGRHNGYHGSTVAGASLGGMKGMHKQGGLPIPGIVHIDPPYWFGDGGDLSEEEYGKVCAKRLEDKILELGPDKVAAFIGEPIMGAIGVYIPPRNYWQEIEKICRRYDVLLVADEVICGFGRTGRWFAAEHFGFQPDVMTLAKGITSGYIPLGAVMFNDRVAGVLASQGGELAHGYTYSGHPVCAAVALENIRILEEERIVDRAREEIAPYLAERW